MATEHPSVDTLLAAHHAFYEAFAAGEADAVVGWLSTEEEQAVIHPGWPPLRGREVVHTTWSRVAADPPPVHAAEPVVQFLGPGLALVTGLEIIGTTVLAATNLWRMEAGGWRLLHHHAGEVAAMRTRLLPAGEDVH